jgi:hypothetical protein
VVNFSELNICTIKSSSLAWKGAQLWRLVRHGFNRAELPFVPMGVEPDTIEPGMELSPYRERRPCSLAVTAIISITIRVAFLLDAHGRCSPRLDGARDLHG